METYSRDVMATALRELDRVIGLIRSGTFNPDATRSGVFAKQVTPSSSTSSSRSPSSGPCSDDANLTDTEPEDLPHDVILNHASGIFHLRKDDERMVCGKVHPERLTFMKAPPVGARLCASCW